MRTGSTSERTQEIVIGNASPNFRSAAYLEIYNNSRWETLQDLDSEVGLDWTESGKREKYANYALTPLAGTISFVVNNENGKYSDGSNTNYEGVIDKEKRVRINAGHLLTSLSSSLSETLDLNYTNGIFVKTYNYHTSYSGSYSSITSTGLGEAPPHFRDVFEFYDAQNYDTTTYSLDAYVISTFDGYGTGWNLIDDFVVNCNNTNGLVYYRLFDDPSLSETSKLSDWTLAGATVNGDKTVTVDKSNRFLQIAVTYDGITYADDLRVNSMIVNYRSYVEWIYKSVYYLDRPAYNDPEAPLQPTIRCSGRDAYKKALETDLNIEDLTGGVSIETIIKDVADGCGISYSSDSIEISGSFPPDRTFADGTGIVKGDKIFNYCMEILNKDGYQMYMQYDDTFEDNIIYVKEKPSTADASGAFNFKNYVSIGDVSKNSDRILQRLTVISDENTVGPKEQISSDNFSSTGLGVISWVGNYEYKSFTITGGPAVISDWEVTPTGASFNIDSIDSTITITSFGNPWKSTAPDYEGEAFDIDNHFVLDGITSKIINPLVISDAECKEIADSFIRDYGEPFIEARELRWPYLNLQPEINDLFMLWRRYIYTNDVFFVTKIRHYWNQASNPSEWTSFNLEDTGLNRGDPQWDDGITQYDKGWVWDMGISTSQNTKAEVDAISDARVIRNVDFT